MEFMMILSASEGSEVDLLQDATQLADLVEFHDSMVRAGVVLTVEALQPWRRAVRVRYSAGQRPIVDGPSADRKQHVVGVWLIRVSSLNDAIEWAKRIPVVSGEVEVRQTVVQLLPLPRVAIA
jgi:hypothetical protein